MRRPAPGRGAGQSRPPGASRDPSPGQRVERQTLLMFVARPARTGALMNSLAIAGSGSVCRTALAEAAGALPGITRTQDIPVRETAIRYVAIGLSLRATGTVPALRAARPNTRPRTRPSRSRPAPPRLRFWVFPAM